MALGAWLISEMALGYIQALDSYWTNPPNREWVGLIVMGIALAVCFGALLALIGGLASRPPLMWIPLMGVGIWYCLATAPAQLYPGYKLRALGVAPNAAGHPGTTVGDIVTLVFLLVPGIVLILEGLAIRKSRQERTETPGTKSETISKNHNS